jgi:hypothetical protein
VSLGIGALSYAGQFNIMAIAGQDACPDLDVFAACAQDDLATLARSCVGQARLSRAAAPATGSG